MTTVAPSARPFFGSVDTSGDDQPLRDDVESPSLSSSNALARFEFEPGRTSKDGTKVLMVEWEDDETTKEIAGDWEISWEGKRTTLPARDPKPSPPVDSAAAATATASLPPPSSDLGGEQPVNRLYFLLGPGVPVPTAVRLQKGEVTWRTNPLPAIFAPELGATARQAGKKGVLHTVWAKKRLQVLQHEIEHESKNNAEGIGLQMAVAEKEWIEQNFGVVARPGSSSSGGANIIVPSSSSAAPLPNLNSPTSPRSPGGGRLMDKLKGLKLSTSNGAAAGEHNPLSPESSDVAVSGFSSFATLKGDATTSAAALSSLAAKPAQPPPAKRMVAAPRPPDVGKWQSQQQQGMGSLNAFASGDMPGGFAASAPPPNSASGNQGADNDDDDDDDDLFALPMSPRSPEMTKSPFSFAQQDPNHASIDGRTG